jgi:hypothetical protein
MSLVSHVPSFVCPQNTMNVIETRKFTVDEKLRFLFSLSEERSHFNTYLPSI